MLKTIPKAPKPLAPAAKGWRVTVIPRWELDQHHVMVLSVEAWDRMKQTSELLSSNGLTCVDEKHMRATVRPEAAIEGDSSLVFLRALTEPPSTLSRPPALCSMRG